MTNRGTGFTQRVDIVNIQLVEQLVNTFIESFKIEELVEGIRGGGKAIGHGNASVGKVRNHFAERGIFPADFIHILHG
ncbi:Uncharacterised protein [Vibrio cholerae]|nr:Uncharacterised protein [Vibrio cholerae]